MDFLLNDNAAQEAIVLLFTTRTSFMDPAVESRSNNGLSHSLCVIDPSEAAPLAQGRRGVAPEILNSGIVTSGPTSSVTRHPLRLGCCWRLFLSAVLQHNKERTKCENLIEFILTFNRFMKSVALHDTRV
ncbi:hypothetical protein J6590_019101 [Homalodisca vitripennis]|nr:hypothetical protein J6590_019101 [Homalodisca vitripennis]